MRSAAKKVTTAFLVLGLTLLASGPQVYSQTTTDPIQEKRNLFDEGFKVYQQKLEDYNKAHEDYVFYKAQYQKFNTLASKQDAFNATKKMLQARDEVVIYYLATLTLRLGYSVGMSETSINGFKKLIDAETQWFTDHKERLNTAGTLEDLVADSSDASKRYSSDLTFFYQLLATISYGKITDYTDRTGDLLASLKARLEEIRADTRDGYTFSPEKFQTLDRWIFEADSRMVRNSEKMAVANTQISTLNKKGENLVTAYNTILRILGESQLFLKETNSFMKEVIQSIKTGE